MIFVLVAALACGIVALSYGWVAYGLAAGLLAASGAASLVAILAGAALAILRDRRTVAPAPSPAPARPVARDDFAQTGN